jgi:hypothetical protein
MHHQIIFIYFHQKVSNLTLIANRTYEFLYMKNFYRKSTRPEVASVQPSGVDDPSSCSQSAVVTAVSRVPARKTAVIVAEDSGTFKVVKHIAQE